MALNLSVGDVVGSGCVPSGCDETDYTGSAIGIINEASFEKAAHCHPPPFVPIVYAGLFAVPGPSVVLTAPTVGNGTMLYQTALKMTMLDDQQRMAFLKKEVFPKYYYPENATDADRLTGGRYLSGQAVAMIRGNPRLVVGVVKMNFKRFWQPYSYQSDDLGVARRYKVMGLAGFGIPMPFFTTGVIERLRDHRQLSLFYGFMAYFTLVHSLLYGKLRYRVPMDTLYLVLAAAGVVYWLGLVFPRLAQQRGGLLAIQPLEEIGAAGHGGDAKTTKRSGDQDEG
ncbi:MAG: hypothetical protein DRQ40_09705 [Gammaproteobacteria bacterium]|nr:MAG: hypothetical protein DRQ40_09705 [Gammaproteobacteria bacterium]